MGAESGWDLQQAIYAALTTDTALAALVDDIYDHVPANAAFPYVAIGETESVPWGAKDFSGMEHTLTLNVWSRYKGRKEAKQIMAAIHDALHEAALSVTGQTLVNLRFKSAGTRLESDGVTRHAVVRYRAVTHP